MKTTAPKDNEIKGTILIPASKSISNRILIIEALSSEKLDFENLSNSDDTKILQESLNTVNANKAKLITLDVGMAGTAFRFLTAFLSLQNGMFILTGSERLKERPIKPLVDILLDLGANIQYKEKEGFAPLIIVGKKLHGKEVTIDASISSQFITALMLIAPKIEGGLNIQLRGSIASLPYLKMTKDLMHQFGVVTAFNGKAISISEQDYANSQLIIEADWSSASYFYESLAIAKKGQLTLKNYTENSLQGDSKLAKIFENLGIKTTFQKNEIVLTKIPLNKQKLFKYNFINEPDLVQAIVCTCVALGINAEISGIESLKIKETDRIQALKNEILKLNWDLIKKGDGVYFLERTKLAMIKKELQFNTYNDHRMAMCLAPLSLKYEAVNIENPEVVSKSNVDFWKLIEVIGFKLKL